MTVEFVDLDREVFSTGQAAKICGVAPRTVTQWMSKGMLHGWRIPGKGKDRRFHRDELLRFMRAHGMPTGALEDAGLKRILFVACEASLLDAAGSILTRNAGCVVQSAPCAWTASSVCARTIPDAIVLDVATLGRPVAASIHASIRADGTFAGVKLWGLLAEDQGDTDLGLSRMVQKPIDAVELCRSLLPRPVLNGAAHA